MSARRSVSIDLPAETRLDTVQRLRLAAALMSEGQAVQVLLTAPELRAVVAALTGIHARDAEVRKLAALRAEMHAGMDQGEAIVARMSGHANRLLSENLWLRQAVVAQEGFRLLIVVVAVAGVVPALAVIARLAGVTG